MKPVYVVGHKNPDNDAIMSAVCYAAIKNQVDNKNEYVACALGPLPKETETVLERFGMPKPKFIEKIEPAAEGEEKQRIILCDHNEVSQAVDGLENGEVIEIMDHHRIADVQTPQPILFMNMPIGSTSTIIATRAQHYNVEMSEALAGCLLSAIMTDTVMLKSPTATKIDARIAHQLGKIIGEDPIAYGQWVFKSRGSDDFTPEDMVSRDTKLFKIAGKDVYIGQYETVDKGPALEESADILKAMEAYRADKGGATFVMLITDILEEGSQVFVVGDTSIVENGLKIAVSDKGTWVPGLLSRKKQVAGPLIEQG